MKKAKNKSTFRKVIEVVVSIALPLGGGFLISLLTRSAMATFDSFNQPPLSPPAWLFPVAWSILYVMIGIASYLIYRQKKSKARTAAIVLYLIQLAFNFCWTIVFFNLGWFWPAFAWLMVMWVLIIILMIVSGKVSKPAVILLIPYVLWCTFAAYLSLGIAILN